ncbi:sugar phosphate isomerase/epimerase family protein [Litorimonas sp. WD9-15]|uniref:sugar phosphate isomerase/epimerase family protein n=1 Tax=Litorimonas sp. WD9-15 TaxID=3418716 RepID=UPI003CFE40CF
MKTLKGPGIFLAQFMGDAPFDTLDNACAFMADAGYKGVQLPSDMPVVMDLKKCSESQTYADELKGRIAEHGLEITELSTHIQGQLVAVHPAYDEAFDAFAPAHLHGKPSDRQEWAVQQVKYAATASRRLGLDRSVSFPGALVWPFMYPWPQRPAGLVEEGFKELARRWRPILDHYEDEGVDVCYEIHPGEDLHDGITFEMFLEQVNNHPRCNILYDPSHFILQQLDYLDFIDIYKDRIRMFHVKDAEFRPNGRSGVYGGYQGWVDRPGRFRSLGDGQIDFGAIFAKMAANDFDGWAVVEWECALKHNEDGAREGAQFVKDHIIRVTDKAFDDFAGGTADRDSNRRMLGLT